MPNNQSFSLAIAALDKVTAAFLAAREGLALPSRYEADRAAFSLMEFAFRHVNSVSGIAMIPTPGSHMVSAWVLLRSAFEIGLTAYWLTREDDWQEREARWLGWVRQQEESNRKLSGDLLRENTQASESFKAQADTLRQRRLAIASLLPREAREKRPSMPEMLKECKVELKYYIAYRVGTQFSHGDPIMLDTIFESGDNWIRTRDVDYSSWAQLLLMASWSLTQPAWTTLGRAGALPGSMERLYEAHEMLRTQVRELEA